VGQKCADPHDDIDTGADPYRRMHSQKWKDNGGAYQAGCTGAKGVDEVQGADGVSDLA
jgi:hypothetical protein